MHLLEADLQRSRGSEAQRLPYRDYSKQASIRSKKFKDGIILQ